MTMDGLQSDLLLLLHEGDKTAGELAGALEELGGRRLALATLYRHLQRLVDSKWIEIDDSRSATALGRPRRSYSITEAGRRCLRRALDEQNRRLVRAAASGLLEG